jgi:peroxiredoxin
LRHGQKAPDFRLHAAPDHTVALTDFSGQPVVLAFYPSNWNPVCADQMALYNEALPRFRRHNAALLGLSVDSVWCHRAFARQHNLKFPLLADFQPKGRVASDYGVYRRGDGVAGRALFVLDANGIVHWSHLSPIGVIPSADGILKALESLPVQGVAA